MSFWKTAKKIGKKAKKGASKFGKATGRALDAYEKYEEKSHAKRLKKKRSRLAEADLDVKLAKKKSELDKYTQNKEKDMFGGFSF